MLKKLFVPIFVLMYFAATPLCMAANAEKTEEDTPEFSVAEAMDLLRNNPLTPNQLMQLRELAASEAGTSLAPSSTTLPPNSGLVKKAVLVAGALAAAWFGPAYVAVAARAIFPYVYMLMGGDNPSQLGWLSYLSIYRPALENFVAAAHARAPIISTVAYGAACLVAQLGGRLSRFLWLRAAETLAQQEDD